MQCWELKLLDFFTVSLIGAQKCESNHEISFAESFAQRTTDNFSALESKCHL